MKLSVVIAAYNESENIGPLTSRLIATLDGMEDSRWELIYVIEGTDDTRLIAQAFADEGHSIRILYNAEPSGLGNAFRKGFEAIAADTDVVITLDADLNHRPEEIPKLVHALLERNVDIVVGSRKVSGSITEGTPLWKRVLSGTFSHSMTRLIGLPVDDLTSGYRAYRYDALSKISFQTTGFAFLPEMLMRAHALGFRIVEEPIHFVYRTAGRSKLKFLPTAWSYVALLCRFSIWNARR
jgi:dolichol-phosphate mannosyltransferase